MATRRLGTLVLCWLVAVGVVAGAGAAVDGPPADEPREHATPGSQLSAFMQSSAAETEETVDTSMWAASATDADDVDERGETLAKRAAEIEAERERLIDAREAGDVDRLVYEAQMSGVVGRAVGLETALDRTSAMADETRADRIALERVHADAANATGPEMRAVPRGSPGGEPPGLDNRTMDDATFGPQPPGPPADNGDRTPGRASTNETNETVVVGPSANAP